MWRGLWGGLWRGWGEKEVEVGNRGGTGGLCVGLQRLCWSVVGCFLFWGFGLRGWGNGGVTFRVLIAEGLVRFWAVGREDVWYRLEAMLCYARYLSGACRYDMHWPQCASCVKGCGASRAVWICDTVDCVHLGGRGEYLTVGFEGTKGPLRGVDLLDKGVAGGQVDSGHENGWDCVLRLFQVRTTGHEPIGQFLASNSRKQNFERLGLRAKR